MSHPLSDLVRTQTFESEDEQRDTFQRLKHSLTYAPVLRQASSEEEFTLSIDACAFAVGATLNQGRKPVALLSHQLDLPNVDGILVIKSYSQS